MSQGGAAFLSGRPSSGSFLSVAFLCDSTHCLALQSSRHLELELVTDLQDVVCEAWGEGKAFLLGSLHTVKDALGIEHLLWLGSCRI